MWQFGVFRQVMSSGLCDVLRFLVRITYLTYMCALRVFFAKFCTVSVVFLQFTVWHVAVLIPWAE